MVPVSVAAFALTATVVRCPALFAATENHAAIAQTPDRIPAKTVLRYRAEVGRTERLKHTANVTVADGQSTQLRVVEVDKLTFTKIDAATGNVTFESRTESNKVTLSDGTAIPDGDDKDGVDTVVTSPTNLIVNYKSATPGEESNASIRIDKASIVVFSDLPVSVGDKWSHDYKADAALKTPAAHADFEIIGAVKVNGAMAFKIKMTYAETGDKPMSGTGMHLIEIASGDELSSDSSFSGMTIGNQSATAKVTTERLEGGPLASSNNGS